MAPGGCHHWTSLFSKVEVTLLLIIFHISSLEDWLPRQRVVHELTLSCCLETVGICAKLIVSSYLIQCVLVAYEFIFCKIDGVPSAGKTFELFRSKILAP